MQRREGREQVVVEFEIPLFRAGETVAAVSGLKYVRRRTDCLTVHSGGRTDLRS